MLVAPGPSRRETHSGGSVFSPEVATSIARDLLLHQDEGHVALALTMFIASLRASRSRQRRWSSLRTMAAHRGMS
jgi:hypothetical protein